MHIPIASKTRSGVPTDMYSRAGTSRALEAIEGINFPTGMFLLTFCGHSWYFARSVNIMVRRNLTPAEIGDIVRTTRKAAGLRQDELAGAAGVGLRFIVDLEAGKPTAQIGKTLQVLAALGCSIDITPPPEPRGARKA